LLLARLVLGALLQGLAIALGLLAGLGLCLNLGLVTRLIPHLRLGLHLGLALLLLARLFLAAKAGGLRLHLLLLLLALARCIGHGAVAILPVQAVLPVLWPHALLRGCGRPGRHAGVAAPVTLHGCRRQCGRRSLRGARW